MRPVNLIPPDIRRGDTAPARAGALSWVLVGVLALAVVAVGAVTLLDKDVNDKEARVAQLEIQEAELTARAGSLSSFVEFQSLADARTQTVAALAESRFDWERVMRELALVLPPRIWLIELVGTVAPAGEAIPGPSLTLIGCGRSQRDVARLIAAIGDIDGVTRVTANESKKTEDPEQDGDTCRTRDFIPQFKVTAAFEPVAVPAGAAPTAPAPASPGDPTAPAGNDGGVGEAQQQRASGEQQVDQARDDAGKAKNLLDLEPGE